MLTGKSRETLRVNPRKSWYRNLGRTLSSAAKASLFRIMLGRYWARSERMELLAWERVNL
jgi:hypothetical protein